LPESDKIRIFYSDSGKITFLYPNGDTSEIDTSGAIVRPYETIFTYSSNTSIYDLQPNGGTLPKNNSFFLIKISSASGSSNQVSIKIGNSIIPTTKYDGTAWSYNELSGDEYLYCILEGSSCVVYSGYNVVVINNTNIQNLKTLITNNGLQPNILYSIAYRCQYYYDGAITTSNTQETLVFRAVSNNKLDTNSVISLENPTDEISFDINSSFLYGNIKKRKDTSNNIEADFDFRNIRFKRGFDPITNSYILCDPQIFSANVQACSVINGVCKNIKITSPIINQTNPSVDSTTINSNINIANVVFYNCTDIEVQNSYLCSFVKSSNSVESSYLKVINSNKSIFKDISNTVVENSEKTRFYGSIVGNSRFCSFNYLNIKNIKRSTFNTALSNSTLDNIEDSVVTNITNSEIFGMKNSYVANSSGLDISILENCSILNTIRTKVFNLKGSMLLGVESSIIQVSSNLIFSYNKSCNISNLNGCYRDRIIGSVVNFFVGSTNKYTVGTTNIPVVGDSIKITNNANFLQTNLSVDFDTNNDSLPNTQPYPILNLGSPSNTIPSTNVLVMIFDGTNFHNVDTSETANKYTLRGDGIIFNLNGSNITESVSVTGNTIELSNAFYDVGCAKYLKINNTANSSVSIINGINRYPTINKIFSNSNNVTTTYLNDATKSQNRIILSENSINVVGVYDFVEFSNLNSRYLKINHKNY